ncbi:DUF2399 domain-containing protein [Streptomyces solaniscabiei]|uniref:DUF2399 domain-containing protein n=1 Tax=Streptomyces solaniscabiei TaxID=2683255 RepID=UPI001CE2D48B
MDAQSRSADFRILARRLAQALDDAATTGDLEWGGGRIATALARSVPWRPWRYTAGEYRPAVTTLAEARALRGPPAATPLGPGPGRRCHRVRCPGRGGNGAERPAHGPRHAVPLRRVPRPRRARSSARTD